MRPEDAPKAPPLRDPLPGVNLLLALLRGEPAPGDSDPRWPETLALAERHGVAPLLHQNARGLPGGARDWLRAARVASLREWLRKEKSLRRALGALPGAVPYKGAAYATTLYESPELRPCADIDLLHPDAQCEGHERTYLDEDGVAIDVHRAFIQPERTRLDPRAVWSRARDGQLDPDDAVLVHCLNLAVHELRSPLIQLVDLQRLWSRCDPETVLRRAREARLENALHGAVRLTERLLRISLVPLMTHRIIDWMVGRYDLSRRPLGRAEQLLRKALFIDRTADRVRFALSHVLKRRACASQS